MKNAILPFHGAILLILGLAACGSGSDGGSSAKDWQTPELVEINNAGFAQYPQIALDSNGNGIAVWQQHDGTRNNIWANRYTAAGGWGSAALIESDDTGEAYLPQIALDSNGNGIAVWDQWDGTSHNIWAGTYQ